MVGLERRNKVVHYFPIFCPFLSFWPMCVPSRSTNSLASHLSLSMNRGVGREVNKLSLEQN